MPKHGGVGLVAACQLFVEVCALWYFGLCIPKQCIM